MRDWRKELPPGTLLCRKSDQVFAIVINVDVTSYPGPWHQLHLLVLTAKGELIESSIETGDFYVHWLRVRP